VQECVLASRIGNPPSRGQKLEVVRCDRIAQYDLVQSCVPARGCYSSCTVILQNYFYPQPDIVPEMFVIVEIEKSEICVGQHFGRHYLHVSGGKRTSEGFYTH
jgi:hypothetical protein